MKRIAMKDAYSSFVGNFETTLNAKDFSRVG
jgi:hypothetical protein